MPDEMPDGEMPVPVTGEPVEVSGVVPSPAEQRADAKGRVGNTVTQVGVPASLVAIGTWAFRLGGVDLDPGAGVDMPAEIVGAFIAVGTWAMARWMNREGLNASDERGVTSIELAVLVLVVLVLLLAFGKI
jgi:hypothetical protein